MNETPFLAHTHEALTLHQGSQTQIRRVIRGNTRRTSFGAVGLAEPDGIPIFDKEDGLWFVDGGHWIGKCPFGNVGDRLWVQERWAFVHYSTDYETGGETNYSTWEEELHGAIAASFLGVDPRGGATAAALFYGADSEPPAELEPLTDLKGRVIAKAEIGWSPARKLPRWAARTVLELKNVRIERLKAITEADAKAQGAAAKTDSYNNETHRWKFMHQWNSVAKMGQCWENDPLVWVGEVALVKGK